MKRFGAFIREQITGASDIGPGPSEMPGYFDWPEMGKYRLWGVDPIGASAFRGFLITGCGEFLPLPDNSIDNVVFATSLDHLVSEERGVMESCRVLAPGGMAFVWMSDRSFAIRMQDREAAVRRGLRRALRSAWSVLTGKPRPQSRPAPYVRRVGRFQLYGDHTAFHIPAGAPDAFHSRYEDPVRVVRLFAGHGLQLARKVYNSRNEVFLSFRKPASTARNTQSR